MLTVEVCFGSACHLKGAYEVVSIFENLAKKNNFNNKVKKRHEDDSKIIHDLINSEDKIVICGGTTANIAARELNRDLIVDTNSYTSELPPIASMDGIDLVTLKYV